MPEMTVTLPAAWYAHRDGPDVGSTLSVNGTAGTVLRSRHGDDDLIHIDLEVAALTGIPGPDLDGLSPAGDS